jgi:hypothetical protein
MQRLTKRLCLLLVVAVVVLLGVPALPADLTKSPHGIFDLLTDTSGQNRACWTNHAIDGVRWRGTWNHVQREVNGPYDWSVPDAAVALAQRHGKQIGLSFAALMAPPEGLEAAECKFVQLSYGRIPWINDPVFLAKWTTFIKAAGARYDGKVDYIAMGGLGRVIESGIGATPSDMSALDAFGGLAGWEAAVKAITDAHAAAFLQTPFIFTAAKPYKSPLAADSLRRVLDELARKYPRRFGIMDCSLNAHADTRYLPHEYVKKYSETNPVGLQFLTSTRGFGGHALGGTVAQTLDAAVALGAHWIEIYPLDGDDPANAELLKATSAKLAR